MGWCPQMGSLLESSGSFLLVPGQPVGRPGAWVPWGKPDTCSHLRVLESGVKSGAHVTRPPQCGGCLSAGQSMPGGGEAGMGNVNCLFYPHCVLSYFSAPPTCCNPSPGVLSSWEAFARVDGWLFKGTFLGGDEPWELLYCPSLMALVIAPILTKSYL